MARPAVARSGSSDAFWIARLARAAKPVFVITQSAQDAERLRDEIAWFDPGLAVHRLPDWEILPYDQFSPHPDLVSERLATLHQFSQGACDVGIIPDLDRAAAPARRAATSPRAPSSSGRSRGSTSRR